MSAPAVDIVIPCFNGERFLGQTLDSALAQTHPAVHVLVVDDGSTDGTRALVEARGGRVDYLHKENGGQASARNLGIARTAAPYVCLLDADDLLDPSMIERLVARLEANPSAGLAHSSVLAFWGDDVTFPQAEHWRPGGPFASYLEPLSLLCAIHGSATVFRRSALERIGTLPEARALQGCEDWHFWLQAVLRGVVIERVPDVLCLYRLHAGGSGSSSLAVARRESALMRSARDLFARHGETGERSRSFLAAGMASVASRWLLLGEPAAYHELMVLARAEAPEAFREARLGEIRNALPAARLPSAADESALLHLRLGDALASLGSPVLAATLFLRCRTFSRLRSVAARFGEGETLDRMLLTLARVVDAALTERERGSPASFATHVATALGLVERSAGRLEEARARFEEALLLDANNTWAALELLALDLRGGRLLAARRRWSALGRGGSRRALRAGALWILQRHPRLRELARSLAAKTR